MLSVKKVGVTGEAVVNHVNCGDAKICLDRINRRAALLLGRGLQSGVGVILPLAVVSTLAVACAPSVAPGTLAAVAQTESHLDPLAIHDNTEGRSYQPGDTARAIGLAHRLIAERHSVDLGLMQINSGNSRWLGLTVEDAFDPCRSIAAGAAVLTAYSRYNTGSPTAGFRNGYVARVLVAEKCAAFRELFPDHPDLDRPPCNSFRELFPDQPDQHPLPWDVFPDPPPAADPSNPFVRPGRTSPNFVVHSEEKEVRR